MGRSYFHLHLVSDATGETLIAVEPRRRGAISGRRLYRAHLSAGAHAQRSSTRFIAEIRAAPGIVLFTLVDQALTERLQEACQECGAPSLSVLSPS